MYKYLIVLTLTLVGCFQAYDDGDELRTIPVTNNPHVVPTHGGAIPGLSTGQGPR
jgi:hypothetical protein